MTVCTECNEKIAEGNAFCGRCGAPVANDAAGGHGTSQPHNYISESEYAAFVGKNAEAYLERFRKFNAVGGDNFKATWHWWAFLSPVFWLLYRKLHIWALIAFLIGLIPYAGLLEMVAFGITGHYIYYRSAQNKILDIKRNPPSDILTAISTAGGVNKWVLTLVYICVAFAVAGIIAAIAIPQFA